MLLMVGGVFVIEALSVMLQVSVFKMTRRTTGTGRRLFKMTPLHHHFEMQDWKESKIVFRFLRYSSRPSPRLFVGERNSMHVTSVRLSTSRISTQT